MAVDTLETEVYLGCKNKNVYCMPIESTMEGQEHTQKKAKRVFSQHRNEITCMTLSKNETRLIVGSSDGVLYIWSLEKEDEMKPLEIHKDKGAISNIIPIMKPVCLFGLKTKIRDTNKLPFLTTDTENCTFDKAIKKQDKDLYSEFMVPKEKLDLHMYHKSKQSKMYLGKSNKQMDSEYWEFISAQKNLLSLDKK